MSPALPPPAPCSVAVSHHRDAFNAATQDRPPCGMKLHPGGTEHPLSKPRLTLSPGGPAEPSTMLMAHGNSPAAPPCPAGPCRRDPHPLPFHLHDSKCSPSLKPHFSAHDSGLQRSPQGICEGHAVARCGGRAAACGRPSLGPLAASPAALIGEGCSSAAKVPGSNLTNNPLPSPPRAVPLNPVITSAKLPLPCAAPR